MSLDFGEGRHHTGQIYSKGDEDSFELIEPEYNTSTTSSQPWNKQVLVIIN